MKLKSILMSTAAAGVMLGGTTLAVNSASHSSLPECENCADTMTIVSWGGAYSNSQNEAYHKPYMEMTGVKIINDESSNEAVAKMRAMAEANNVTWDVVDVVASDAIRLCDEGLAMEIDADEQLAPAPDGTPASEDFGDLMVSECFVPQIVYSTTFGYRTDMVGDEPPTDICAVFDLEKYPGKRSLEKRAINNVEWALLCDGVPKDEVYDVLSTPEGVERALAKLDTIKDQVIWWSAGAETPQLLADGEVVMGSTYNGRLFSVIEEQDQPVAMLWDAQVFDLDGWIIPAGLPEERKNRALHYLKFATDTQRLADQAKYISYGPARKSSAPLVGKHAELGIDMAPHMPTDPNNAKNTFLYNYVWWADNRDDVEQKFQSWLAQ
jgi:putative spermidine/putrescine transport system substrate-binding protein